LHFFRKGIFLKAIRRKYLLYGAQFQFVVLVAFLKMLDSQNFDEFCSHSFLYFFLNVSCFIAASSLAFSQPAGCPFVSEEMEASMDKN